MTSMPASRRARAMTFAPRSCPSSPGLAITTLSLRILGPGIWGSGFGVRDSGFGIRDLANPESQIQIPNPESLDDWHFLVFAPHFTERVAHLADRRVSPHGVENREHHVLGRARRDAQPIERPLNGDIVALALQPFELRDLFVAR